MGITGDRTPTEIDQITSTRTIAPSNSASTLDNSARPSHGSYHPWNDFSHFDRPPSTGTHGGRDGSDHQLYIDRNVGGHDQRSRSTGQFNMYERHAQSMGSAARPTGEINPDTGGHIPDAQVTSQNRSPGGIQSRIPIFNHSSKHLTDYQFEHTVCDTCFAQRLQSRTPAYRRDFSGSMASKVITYTDIMIKRSLLYDLLSDGAFGDYPYRCKHVPDEEYMTQEHE